MPLCLRSCARSPGPSFLAPLAPATACLRLLQHLFSACVVCFVSLCTGSDHQGADSGLFDLVGLSCFPLDPRGTEEAEFYNITSY